MVFPVLGVMGDFQFYPGHFVCRGRRLWLLLFFFFNQEVTMIRFNTQIGSIPVDCSCNDNLLFRAFSVTVLVCLAYLVQLGLSLVPAGAM